MAASIKTRKEAEQYLTDKAMRDPRFRGELLADPKAVIARELGVGFTSNVKVTVLEETPRAMYLVLPSNATDDSELADAELDAVAGGKKAREEDASGGWGKIKGTFGAGSTSTG
jgi:hypothetical protein